MSERPSFDEALAIIAAAVPLLPVVTRPLASALGCAVAAPVFAVSDHPRFNAAAMDGYACAAGVSGLLRIARAGRAGTLPPPLAEGTTQPIATGAPLPRGADAVLLVEQARTEEGRLHLAMPLAPGTNVRRRGEDAHVGAAVLVAGQRVTAAAIGALASYGVKEVAVRTPPACALLPTGDEIADQPGQSVPEAQVHDSNTPMLAALATESGLPLACARPAPDDDRELATALDAALAGRPALVLTTGGTSAGAHDRVPALLAARGARVHFHGVRMRPGKPVLFATLPCGTPFFGLPGNPVAALLGFRFLVLHAVRAMMGLPPESGRAVAGDLPGRAGTSVFLKVACADGDVRVLPGQQSHLLRPLLDADAIARVEPDGRTRIYPVETRL